MKQLLDLLAELLEREPGTISPSEALADIGWDSMAVVGFIALADDRFGVIVDARRLATCATVEDLAALLGDKVAA
jgi:acyl carrier protein